MRSNGYSYLGMYTQVLEPIVQDIISNEKNKVIAIGFSINSCTAKGSAHISIAKKTLICVIFVCNTYA